MVEVIEVTVTSFKGSHVGTAALSALTLQQATADPCLCWRLLDIHRAVSCGVMLLSSGSWCVQGVFVFVFVFMQDSGVEGPALMFSARTPKLQLTAKQPLRGKCWIPLQKITQCPRANEKPQQDCKRGEIHLESNPILPRDTQRAQTKPCAHQDPETPQRLRHTCL